MNRPVHGGNLAWARALAGCSPMEILDFSASINPLGPPKSAIAAIQSHLEALTAYPDPDYSELRTALGNFHHLPPEWILPGNGAAELLTWAARELSGLDETYLFTPAFGGYQRALKAFKARVKEYSLFGYEPGKLEQQNAPLQVLSQGEVRNALPDLTDWRTEKIRLAECGLLMNNPHNPTGQLWSREAILPYLEQMTLVVVDEAFMDFLPPEADQSLIPWVSQYPNLVIVRSLTKFYSLPGLRLGYAVAHPDRLQQWSLWRDPWPVNTLAEKSAIALVQDTEFQQQTWAWLPEARSQLFSGLQKLSGLHPYPSAANFLLVKSDHSCTQLQQALLENDRILIRDCLSFPQLGDRYFRVAVRTAADNQRLIAALTALIGIP